MNLDWLDQNISVSRSGCWIWTGRSKPSRPGHGTDKYGYVRLGGRAPKLAHRAAFEALVGPIPSGLTIDHLCRETLCVNPNHMEPVTLRENILRGFSFSANNARKTHCFAGHEFTPENTYMYKGNRLCRACNLIYATRYYHRKRGKQ